MTALQTIFQPENRVLPLGWKVIASLINEFYVEFVYIVIINEFQFNICGYLFTLLLINFIFYVIFYLLLYVPEFFFLSYSFVMFRIDFLLSIWVNLHIYIDIVFVGLVFGLKCLLIILYCIWHMKHLYFFEEKSKVQPMSSSSGINFYLVCYI